MFLARKLSMIWSPWNMNMNTQYELKDSYRDQSLHKLCTMLNGRLDSWFRAFNWDIYHLEQRYRPSY